LRAASFTGRPALGADEHGHDPSPLARERTGATKTVAAVVAGAAQDQDRALLPAAGLDGECLTAAATAQPASPSAAPRERPSLRTAGRPGHRLGADGVRRHRPRPTGPPARPDSGRREWRPSTGSGRRGIRIRRRRRSRNRRSQPGLRSRPSRSRARRPRRRMRRMRRKPPKRLSGGSRSGSRAVPSWRWHSRYSSPGLAGVLKAGRHAVDRELDEAAEALAVGVVRRQASAAWQGSVPGYATEDRCMGAAAVSTAR